MKKKLITLLLTASMAMASLAGCGQAKEEGKTSESTAKESSVSGTSTEQTETAGETSNFNEEGYPIVNEEITLNILLGTQDNYNGIDPAEMPAIQRLEELTGIKTHWEVVKAADWSTKLNLIFASEEYPDMIIAPFCNVDYEEYGVSQQILIPLDDLIDKYLTNYTERIAMEGTDPTARLAASDGQTYTIGYMNNSSELMVNQFHINKNWLEALKLDMPENIEQLTDVLRAFKAKDPNGNGEADEIPLMGGMGDTVQYNVAFYLQLFGVPYNMENWMYIDDDKKVQFVPWQDGFRECMEWLHVCYEEGLLDVEVFSQDINTVAAKLKEGAGFSSFYIPRSDLRAEGWEQYELYMPDENASLTWIYSSARAGTYITTTNEYPEATMRFLNAMLEKETMYSLYIGEKDGTGNNAYWDYNDQGLIEQFLIEGKEAPSVRNCLNVNTMFFAPGEYYRQNFEPSINKGMKDEFDAAYRDTGLLLKYSHTYLKWIPFTSEQNQELALMKTEIDTAVEEYMTLFIKDGVTDDSWNKFVEILKNVKAENYVQMYQDGIDALDIE